MLIHNNNYSLRFSYNYTIQFLHFFPSSYSIFLMPEVIKAASCGSIIKKPRSPITLNTTNKFCCVIDKQNRHNHLVIYIWNVGPDLSKLSISEDKYNNSVNQDMIDVMGRKSIPSLLAASYASSSWKKMNSALHSITEYTDNLEGGRV
jgi:hypothetical protein